MIDASDIKLIRRKIRCLSLKLPVDVFVNVAPGLFALCDALEQSQAEVEKLREENERNAQ